MMLESFVSIIICGILFAGAYYASHYVVNLRLKYASAQHDIEEAKTVIAALEDRIEQLEFERDDNAKKFEQRVTDRSRTSWEAFNR